MYILGYVETKIKAYEQQKVNELTIKFWYTPQGFLKKDSHGTRTLLLIRHTTFNYLYVFD